MNSKKSYTFLKQKIHIVLIKQDVNNDTLYLFFESIWSHWYVEKIILIRISLFIYLVWQTITKEYLTFVSNEKSIINMK